MKKRQAGTYDQRVTIQRRNATADRLNEMVPAWQDVATVWARARPLRGREFIAASQAGSELSVEFAIRYRDDVLATMRVQWRGKAFDIVGDPIDVDGQRWELLLMCASGVGDAVD
jgi:SPP1 family predicted phage head-tail adaptor